MHSLKEKVTVVTGGARGIGAAIVKEFLKEGVKHVSIWDISKEAGLSLEKALTELYDKKKVEFVECDVTNDDQLFAAFKKTSEYGYIDVVVNNAGIADERLHMFKRLIDVNYSALVSSTLKAFELMREDKGGHGGTIINISSAAALMLVAPSLYIYAATKAAVLHLTCSMGMENYYSSTKVRTIAVCFGSTMSEINNSLGSFDNNIETLVKMFSELIPVQPAEAAAIGVIEAFKSGKSGSAWYVYNGKPAREITDKLNKAYDILSEDLFD